MKQIIVLGGGYGGILTAKKLAKRLRKQKDLRITLIDRKPYHTLLTELHEVAANRVEEDSIKVDLQKVFAGFRNVDVVLDEIGDIDFDNQRLRGEKQTYNYDYLVIGTGSKPTFFGIPGADQHAFTLWSYDDAVRLKEHTLNMFRKAVLERDPQVRKEMLTFVVVGGGFTGVEMIGELAEFTKELCKEFHVEPSEVTLHVADMVDKILPILPEPLIRKAEKRLRKMDVNIITGSKITEVKADGVTVGGSDIKSRTVIWTAGVEGSDVVGSMDVEQKGRKRILTNDKLQIPAHPNVYVVGDNIFYIPEGAAAPVPQMVENAELAAPVIAFNIVAELLNKPMKSYKPTFHGTMVCIGSRYGVANVGVPGHMFKLSGFLAMAVKHLINMVYLFQVCGFNKVYHYLLHEFFHVRNNRSFLGGHFAKRSPNFWLVPLRIFAGWMWLSQGWDKIHKIIDDPDKVFLIPAKAADGVSAASAAGADAAGAGAADAVSAASAYTAEAVSALPVPDFIKSMVDWSMDLMFYTGDGGYTSLAYVFQTSMVLAELIVGILLIVGLFTAPAAIASVAMGAMVWVSGMAPNEMLWYLAAGIALIGGSGSTLGLDYYVYPWLKKVWKRIPLVRRWYVYTD
ncbi:FAD-dependent pyridine nucleotide-disulfide oxidoreductase [Paenibacillus vortex V453]|uniref:NADH:ubiquinone reductase (non-electrogenic) n=1 Tax=Paenibacillus vortex V453 TaxID=715225 RepID=A0A2R9T0L5_9BACL|nr:FAD-dependent oxidoreductase [Paenibacillus vortex]EFU43174.1 FAD-dependent pyridine nucleotide-disulfide oxidoreductase [Paenibacillus vortex V453]